MSSPRFAPANWAARSVIGRPISPGNQPEQAARGGREILDAHFQIQKDRRDLRAVQQILQIAVGVIEFRDFAVQLGIDRFQFFVEGLELLLGGFQLLVRGLKLLVGGLQLLIRGFELFESRLTCSPGRREVRFRDAGWSLRRRLGRGLARTETVSRPSRRT